MSLLCFGAWLVLYCHNVYIELMYITIDYSTIGRLLVHYYAIFAYENNC